MFLLVKTNIIESTIDMQNITEIIKVPNKLRICFYTNYSANDTPFTTYYVKNENQLNEMYDMIIDSWVSAKNESTILTIDLRNGNLYMTHREEQDKKRKEEDMFLFN